MENLIEVRGLSRAFRTKVAVQDVDLQLRPGEILALLGPDGAGKTTTIRLLCGVLRADSGQITIGGIDLKSDPERARSILGYLPQQFSMYAELTVLENLRFFAEVRGIPPAEWRPRSMDILQFVGLDEFAERRAGALSGGMRQKLGLAVALVHRPRLLLLDEPTGGVDPVTRQAFWQLLIRLLHEGVGVLISTPYMDEAARAQNVAFLREGRILASGSPKDLCHPLQGRVLEIVAGPRQMVETVARRDPQVEAIQMTGGLHRIRVASGALPAVMQRLPSSLEAAGCTLTKLMPAEPTLEDAFTYLIQPTLGGSLNE